jgi:MraZ protein
MTLVFRGRVPQALDPKGRITVPRRFRDVLAGFSSGSTVVVVSLPGEEFLSVYPLEAWERWVETKAREMSPFDASAREFGRRIASRGRDTEMDAAGRILLQPAERQQAGLGRDVILIGGAMECFEVWDRARFEAHEHQGQHTVPDLMQRFSAGHGS